ncbi:hypothetical protein EUTSA_v10029344mg, partial [Eutrema salsugineum]
MINCKAMEFLNMKSKRIKDKIPSWLGSLPLLYIPILRSTEFYGSFFCKLSTLPVGVKQPHLRKKYDYLNTTCNAFTRRIPKSMKYLTKLEELDMSPNQLS